MQLPDRILAFSKLAEFLKNTASENQNKIQPELKDDYISLNELIKNAHIHNPWFTEEFVRTQILALAESMIKDKIEKWILPYSTQIEQVKTKKVGVIMAGNIALVGFHDFVSVLISGHHFVGKLSSKDSHLPKKIAEILIKIEQRFADKITFVEDKLKDFEAVIATGSNNSARYFEYYFSKVPNIIRKSRNSLAVLTGNETDKELQKLADDIFLYFGLGCRNISKVFVPANYKFNNLFQALYKYQHIINHNKYANNYDYNRAVFLMNRADFLENNFFIIKPDFSLHSPVAVLHYENYEKLEHVEKYIKANEKALQCVVSNEKSITDKVFDIGQSQYPELSDYEDNIDTIEFLTSLK